MVIGRRLGVELSGVAVPPAAGPAGTGLVRSREILVLAWTMARVEAMRLGWGRWLPRGR